MKQTTHKLLSTAAAVCLLFGTTTSVFAQSEFAGSLNTVTISDAAGTNNPPKANFTYIQDGDNFTFDASGSSDLDGSIVDYKWNFGNGEVSEGVIVNYTQADTTILQATLTVIDNNNGVALSQQIITPATMGVADDFSTDTSGEYTLLSGGLSIHNGAAHSSGAWTTTYAIHNQDLRATDHSVEADLYYDGGSAAGGLMLRIDKLNNTGYVITFGSGRIILSSYSNRKETWLAHFDGKYSAGIYHVKAEISGDTIKVYNNGQLVLEKSDSTYSNGTFVGIKIYPYGKNDIVTVDNLKGN